MKQASLSIVLRCCPPLSIRKTSALLLCNSTASASSTLCFFGRDVLSKPINLVMSLMMWVVAPVSAISPLFFWMSVPPTRAASAKSVSKSVSSCRCTTLYALSHFSLLSLSSCLPVASLCVSLLHQLHQTFCLQWCLMFHGGCVLKTPRKKRNSVNLPHPVEYNSLYKKKKKRETARDHCISFC